MAVLKLSQIAAAGSAPALTDTVIGVGGGTTDLQYTITQIAAALPLASSSQFGVVKVDGTTITAAAGVISAVATAPGGSNTQVQFNDSGVFNGDADFLWDKSNHKLKIITAAGSSPTELIDLGSNGAYIALFNDASGDSIYFGGLANAPGGFIGSANNQAGKGFFFQNNNAVYGWGSFNANPDTGIGRNSAGVVEANHGVSVADGGSLATFNAAGYEASGAAGISVTIATAKLTVSGTNGSMTFTNGLLTAQTPAT